MRCGGSTSCRAPPTQRRHHNSGLHAGLHGLPDPQHAAPAGPAQHSPSRRPPPQRRRRAAAAPPASPRRLWCMQSATSLGIRECRPEPMKHLLRTCPPLRSKDHGRTQKEHDCSRSAMYVWCSDVWTGFDWLCVHPVRLTGRCLAVNGRKRPRHAQVTKVNAEGSLLTTGMRRGRGLPSAPLL